MSGSKLRLMCLVWPDDNPDEHSVQVKIDNDETVAFLKDLIKDKYPRRLHNVDASDLILWKCSDLPDDDDLEQTLKTIRFDGSDSRVVHLNKSRQRISQLFGDRDLSKEPIHILVEVPDQIADQHVSKRARLDNSQSPHTPPNRTYVGPTPPAPATISPSASNESNASSVPYTGERPPADQRLPSDHPLHKLWMLAREPRPTLFETRPVQRDKNCLSTETNLPLDCMVLRGGGWVRELQPDSRFTGILIRDEYVGALRAIMKWFLNEVTNDPMEVDDIEPAPLDNPFLDVPLGLVSTNWAFVLLGDPGIGKTAFLYILLVLRLQAQLPTIYQARNTHLYYFADDGVHLINLTLGLIATNFKSQFQKSTWCLIDSNQHLDTVPGFIQDLDLFIVQASSPRPPRYAWIDKATSPVLRYFMKSWTLPELLVGRVLQHKVFSEAQIEFFSTRYGTSARSVYTNSSDPLNYETSLLEKMARITYEGMAKIFREASPLDLAGEVSHQLVSISPGATRNSFQSSFPTRYIYEKFRDGLSAHKLEAVARLYDVFVRNPNTKVPAGFMLEDAVNDVFFRGGEWSLVSLMKSSRMGPKYTHWKNANGPITPQYLHLGYLGHHIAIDTTPHPVGTVYAALPLKRFLPGGPLQLVDGYYYPSSRSQETFDPFIYESASKTATVLQVTTAKSHSVKEGGVKWLQGLGVERFRYIAVTTPNTPIDLPFPNGWNTSTAPSIPEKYLLTVESLPEH